MSNSCPGMHRNSWTYATVFVREGTVPCLCCSLLYEINECSLRVRKSTRMNLPLCSHSYSWWVCAQGGRRWDLLQGKGLEHGPCPVPRGMLWLHCPWVTHVLFLSSTFFLPLGVQQCQVKSDIFSRSMSAPSPVSPRVTAWGGERRWPKLSCVGNSLLPPAWKCFLWATLEPSCRHANSASTTPAAPAQVTKSTWALPCLGLGPS